MDANAAVGGREAGGELEQFASGGFRIGVGAGFDALHLVGPMLHDLASSVVRSPASFSA
jgi:hypothetical protein